MNNHNNDIFNQNNLDGDVISQQNNPLNNVNNIPNQGSISQPNNNINTINSANNPLNNVSNVPNQGSISQPNNNINTINSVNQQNSTFTNTATNMDIQEQIQPHSNIQIDNNELLKTFIGNNYDKITTRKFNFAGFFFSTLYMFYRKMFGYGLLLFALNFIILNFTNYIVYLVFCVVVGLLVNKVYLYFANKKINKIRLSNPQKGIQELKSICSVKGGTNTGAIFLGLLCEFLIAVVILVIMSIFGLTSVITNLFTSFSNDAKSSLNGTYEGVLMTNTSIDIDNEFTITIPSKFEDKSDDYSYEYEYSSDSGVFDKCEISLESIQGFSDASNLINQMADYNIDNNPTKVTKKSINNIDWYWFKVDDSFGTTYYYGTTKNNKVFLLKYEINEDASNDCKSYREQIIKSIKAVK